MTNGYKDWLDLDVDTVEPMELSDARKSDIKRNILAKGRKKKRFMSLRRLTAAAIISVSTVTAMGFAFPTVASQIPFMHNVFYYFQTDSTMWFDVDEDTLAIGPAQTDNGISVMIENAVYDGTTITVAYTIETKKDLGSHPREGNTFDIKKSKGWSATSKPLAKVNNTTYVGLAKITPSSANTSPDEVVLSWNPYSFTNTETNAELKGDWSFEFKLTKLESDLQLINASVEQDGVTVLIKSLQMNDTSTLIHYEQFIDPNTSKQWNSALAQFDTIYDDLGNTYLDTNYGNATKDAGQSWTSVSSIDPIDPNATSLTFVPTIHFVLYRQGDLKDMEPIVIDLQ